MAITTSILTGGSNNHETTSEEANAVYTDFVSEGIVGSVGNTSGVAPATGGFAVNAQGTPDMTVAVSAGVAYVTGTPTSQNSQTFRVKNSATENVTISANSSGSTKYDWVYIKLDATNLNTPNVAGDNVATLVTSRSSSAASDDGTPPTYGYPIAVVTVANGATTITNGNIRDVRAQVALNTGASNSVSGWTSLSTTLTVSTGYNKGNKEYDLTTASDMSSVLSPGMRLKITRGTTPPTQCTDLESGSTHYASLASASISGAIGTFTDDFTCEAWIKLESYTGAIQTIVSRRNASTEGWQFRLDATGEVTLIGLRIAANNRRISSYQAIPLGRWVHVAASLDMSGNTGTVWIDGAVVPSYMTTTGTATALVNANGNLVIGAYASGSEPFDGKISDVRVWNAIRSNTQIRDNMNQQLVGNESNLVGYWKLNGDFNDSTSNANNLSAQNSATATNADNPMNATEYAIVTKVTSNTVTVFTGTDYNIPNMTLSTPYYSTQDTPFGFPRDKGKWLVELHSYDNASTFSSGAWTNSGSIYLSIPTGAWHIRASVHGDATRNTSTAIAVAGALSESSSTVSSGYAHTQDVMTTGGASGTQRLAFNMKPRTYRQFTTQTTVYHVIYGTFTTGALSSGSATSVANGHTLTAECAYV